MIPISEVLEEAAREVKAECMGFADDDIQLNRIVVSIRALAAKYKNCIVAEGAPDAWMSPNMEILSPVRSDTVFGSHTIPLYRARKPETCKPALQVEEAEPVAHRHKWFRTGAMEQGQMRCIECGEWSRETAPPARRPLTDDEMHGLYRRAGLEAYYPRDGVVQYEYERRFDAFARAIERAHGIGGDE